MTKQTHTPGPWSLLTARTLVNVKGANGEQICQVPMKDSANARLIACAPELLEAAEKLEQLLRPIAKVFWAEFAGTENLQALDALRAAIAKARE